MSDLAPLAQIAANPYSGYALPPHWGWYIILYFFSGGLSAGSYFIATMLLLVGDPRDRDTIRLGYLVSFPLLLVCALLLIVDLGVPSRFWHMLVQSENLPELLLKPWSPISVGSWVLTVFGLFSFVAFVGTLVETGRIRSPRLVRLDQWARERPRPFAVLWGVLGTFFGFFLAGYTGVLVTGTSIPVWHNARLLGALFLASAASTSYALLSLALLRRGQRHTDPAVAKLARADRFAIVLELALLAIMLLVLGPVASPIVSGGFGVVFWLGVVGVGLVAPLVLSRSRVHGRDQERRAVIAAACVLAGGLLLRFVIVMSAQFPAVALWAL
jgi:formate-dependent nitrite reductase membrane component NrfD